MELVRALYQRMHRVTQVYRALSIAAVLAVLVLALVLAGLNRRVASFRRQAADVFYQLKALELEVARLRVGAPERQGFLERRAALEALYAEWLDRLDETSRGDRDERAIRAAIARLGEARVLVTRRFVADVQAQVAEWRRTADFTTALRQAADSNYQARIEAVLAQNGLPEDLVWLAFQESRFRPAAVGPPTRFGIAKGMWQFMPTTARHYGLRTGPLVGQARYDRADQRHDFERSTRAAVRYVADLYLLDAQGSGLLVMACYNAGQTRVQRLLRSLPATPRDRNFWRLLERHRDEIPAETYGYVVGIVAAAAVAADPEAFGLAPLPRPRRPPSTPRIVLSPLNGYLQRSDSRAFRA